MEGGKIIPAQPAKTGQLTGAQVSLRHRHCHDCTCITCVAGACLRWRVQLRRWFEYTEIASRLAVAKVLAKDLASGGAVDPAVVAPPPEAEYDEDGPGEAEDAGLEEAGNRVHHDASPIHPDVLCTLPRLLTLRTRPFLYTLDSLDAVLGLTLLILRWLWLDRQ